MDNFDLKKYLAEGRLFEDEDEWDDDQGLESEPDEEIFEDEDEEEEVDYSNISSLEDELRRLIRWSNQYGSKGADSKMEQLKKRIEYLKSTSIKEEFEEEGAEEKAFDVEFQGGANQLAATIGKELKDKKAKNPEAINEAVITSIIAGVLTGNAVLGFISKMSAKLMKKLNWKKGEDFAEKVHKWAHDNEVAFQAPIKRVLAFFIKDPKTLDLTVKAIYAIVVGSMAAGYGVEAVSSLEKADWFNSALSSLKTLAKSDEAIANAFPAIKSLMV